MKLFRLVEGNTFRLNEAVSSYDTTIMVNDPVTDEEREVEVTVQYEYIPAERGSRERGSGAQLEPDYPESVEITSIVDDSGKDYGDQLTQDQLTSLENEILKYEKTSVDDYKTDRYNDY